MNLPVATGHCCVFTGKKPAINPGTDGCGLVHFCILDGDHLVGGKTRALSGDMLNLAIGFFGCDISLACYQIKFGRQGVTNQHQLL